MAGYATPRAVQQKAVVLAVTIALGIRTLMVLSG
jgi:hypothetical protein